MRIVIAVMAIWAAQPGVSFAEICFQLNSRSAIDQAFVAALAQSSIQHSLVRADLPCFPDASEARANALRSKIAAANPQSCLSFEKAWDVPALEKALGDRGIPAWRAVSGPTITVCHLAKDAQRVRTVVQQVFPK